MPRVDRLLFDVGLGHAALALVCLGLLWVDAAPILGVHPAWKPLKFAMSIAVFLGALAFLLPTLSVSEATRRLLSVTVATTMVVEMAIIVTQALRGRRSHFNLDTSFDSVLSTTMIAVIGVFVLALVAIALLATVRPLATSALLATAWRAALWIGLFAAVSGFAMGGRGSHTIGGPDGGPGLPVTNWSTTHGDLRVSHFFALHALQILPLLALGLQALSLRAGVQWTVLGVGIAGNAVLAFWTWLAALAARPLW